MTRVPLKRNLPGGTTTVPPPWLPAASSAAWKAAVSSLTSSPFAPKSYTLRLGSGEAEGRVEGKGKGKGAAGTKPRRKGEGRGEGLAAAAVVGQTKRVAEMQRRKRENADGRRFILQGRIAGQTRFVCKVGAPVLLLPCVAPIDGGGRWLECAGEPFFI